MHAPHTSPTFQRWNDDLLLGHRDIDDCHQAFAQILEKIHDCPATDLEPLFDCLVDHLQVHFESENRLMRTSGFPPRDCHIDEHDAVLQSAFAVQAALAQNNHLLCRTFIKELCVWFPKHTQHLDSALAHWLAKTQLGGKPVILKRNLLLNSA